MKNKKVLIIDSYPIIRHGLSHLINSYPGLTVCGEVDDIKHISRLITRLNPHIAIVSLSLRELNNLYLIKDITAKFKELPVLVFSMIDGSIYADRTLKAGAKGYIMKHEPTIQILMAIQSVLSNELFLSDEITPGFVSNFSGSEIKQSDTKINCLSNRELNIFIMIGHGMGTRQISDKLHVSIKTIETYRARIKEKLNLINATELLYCAIQWVNSEANE